LIKKFLKEIIYSPENVKIRFFYSENSENFPNFASEKTPALRKQSGAKKIREETENAIFSDKSEFASSNSAPEQNPQQTFTIILPNLIHKSKKRMPRN